MFLLIFGLAAAAAAVYVWFLFLFLSFLLLFCFFALSLTRTVPHTHAHTHTCTHAHAHTHARTHTHIHAHTHTHNRRAGMPRYKVGVVCRSGVPPFRPYLPFPAEFDADDDLRHWLFHKIINGERATFTVLTPPPTARR